MKRLVATGRTVEDAVTSALVKLGASRTQAEIRVIREPVKGFLGIFGGKDAEVEVSVRQGPEEEAKDFLRELLSKMGLKEVTIKSRPVFDDDKASIGLEVVCDEEGLPTVIGRHGSTLDALQYLTTLVANQHADKYLKIQLDAGEYRRRRMEGLIRMAERAAIRAVKTRRPVSLEAMSSAERKIIHTCLQDRTDVTTTSEGADPNRKVVILPVYQTGIAR